MIDLHCHILPGIDDGAENLEASIAMAEKAIQQGITHILCTPHHNNGKYSNEKSQVISLVASLQAELEKRQLPLTLLEGQEVRITGTLIEDIHRDEILFTDLDDTYLLIEFPTLEVPLYAERLFFELLELGKTPVIVHPERNAHFREDPNHLLPFLDMGCLAQLTAPSYVGVFGKDIQKTAKTMVKHNLVQMAASDAHGVSKRTFYLKECYEQIAKDFGKEKVVQMKQVAKDLINGDEISYPVYEEVKKKKFGLILASPLMFYVAYRIRKEEPGSPIFFSHTRVGKNGKTFKMHKFRSMCLDAEEKLEELLDQNEIEGAMFKMKEDPRVTQIGKIIRAKSIDELPQLWNVLKGDMSLVGPRPPLEREVAEYTRYDLQRLYVKPGCSGLWQVSGRNDVSFHEMVDLDLEYIINQSILNDIKIIIKTIRVVIKPNSAY